MNTFEILSFVAVILLKSFSKGGGKFQLTSVTYIKEIRLNHDTFPAHLLDNTIAKTEGKRLELCRDGFKQIQKHKLQGGRGKAVFLEGTAPEKLKIYFFEEVSTGRSRVAPAVKCPTDPESYIQINLNSGNENQSLFQVLYGPIRPHTLERIMYEMVRVKEIVRADLSNIVMISEIEKKNPGLKFPIFDTEKLSDDQRLQICLKGVQTVPKLNIELMEEEKTSANNFYSMIRFSSFNEKIRTLVEGFECPTKPKIYISMGENNKHTTTIGLLSVLIETTDGDRQLTSANLLGAHSSEEVAETLYHRIRNAEKGDKVDQIIDSSAQMGMCRSVFHDIIYERSSISRCSSQTISRSTFFLETYDELKKENTALCERLYKNSESVIVPGQDIVILNGPESTDVTVSETEKSVQEDVFVCLIRTDGEHIDEYLITKEYNMNNRANSSNDYIAGRFLFKRSPNNSAVLIGMVEEFAKPLESSNVELLYLERRRKQEIAKSDSDDPLCKLTSFERSRICRLVFNLTSEKVKPTPLYDLGCAKNPVTLTTADGLAEAKNTQYYEYMISCYESLPMFNSPRIYYLSQAYDKSNLSSSDDVFVYYRSTMSRKIQLMNAFTDPRIGDYFTKK